MTIFLKPYFSFSRLITLPLPPDSAVGWVSSNPAYSPKKNNLNNKVWDPSKPGTVQKLTTGGSKSYWEDVKGLEAYRNQWLLKVYIYTQTHTITILTNKTAGENDDVAVFHHKQIRCLKWKKRFSTLGQEHRLLCSQVDPINWIWCTAHFL